MSSTPSPAPIRHDVIVPGTGDVTVTSQLSSSQTGGRTSMTQEQLLRFCERLGNHWKLQGSQMHDLKQLVNVRYYICSRSIPSSLSLLP